MTDDLKASADARLEAALADADHRDPRPFYRIAMRHLRDKDEEGFGRALRYFEESLVPGVAGESAQGEESGGSGEADPLAAWAEYGMVLARTLGSGRTVELDRTGRSRAVDSVVGTTGLVLHIPDATDAPVLVLRYPRDPAPAQHAAYELLVQGRQTASAYG